MKPSPVRKRPTARAAAEIRRVDPRYLVSLTAFALAIVLAAIDGNRAHAEDELVASGEQLAHAGTAEVPACFTCHGADGAGLGRAPRIAGRPANFVTERIHAFQERAQKGPAAPGSMTAVAATLGEAQIAAAAAYLSQLTP
jgi:cytochrome c553